MRKPAIDLPGQRGHPIHNTDLNAELFWIVTHGIKMTGMPAFGLTHEDEEIWALVAFIRQLPDVSPDDYQKMIHESGLPESPGVHAHDGTHGQE